MTHHLCIYERNTVNWQNERDLRFSDDNILRHVMNINADIVGPELFAWKDDNFADASSKYQRDMPANSTFITNTSLVRSDNLKMWITPDIIVYLGDTLTGVAMIKTPFSNVAPDSETIETTLKIAYAFGFFPKIRWVDIYYYCPAGKDVVRRYYHDTQTVIPGLSNDTFNGTAYELYIEEIVPVIDGMKLESGNPDSFLTIGI